MNDRLQIRLSNDSDRLRIERLAELDSGCAPPGDVLLAERDGRLIAAVGVNGYVVADPFERTAGVVRLLRAQLDGKPPRAERRRGLGRLLPYRQAA
jgi:hypothetical protein